MLLNLLLLSTALSFGGMSLMLGLRVRALRGGRAIMASQPSLSSFVAPKASSVGWKLVIFIEELSKAIYLHLLLLATKFLGFLRHGFGSWEQRFIKIVDSVKGRSDISNRGMTSIFLQEIDAHRLGRERLTK